jgi:hypothetical protein
MTSVSSPDNKLAGIVQGWFNISRNKMKRVRRHDRDPFFPDGFSEPYKVLPVVFDRDHLEVRYHRTGWRRLGYEVNEIKRRRTMALIFMNGEHVGGLDTNEFRLATLTSSSEFLEEMDGHTQATYDLADVILRQLGRR